MILSRQTVEGDPAFEGNDGTAYNSFWFSKTGMIIKYVVFGTLLLLVILWVVGGYLHAQRRMKNGLPPLTYHKWLVPRHQRARFEPQLHGVPYYQFPGQHPQQYAYAQYNFPMQTYPGPPPLYNQDVPPTYQPPLGSSKVNPQQNYGAPPPPPPPHSPQQTGVVNHAPTAPAQTHHQTESSNPFRP